MCDLVITGKILQKRSSINLKPGTSLIVNEKTLEPLNADTFLYLMQKFDTSHFPVPTPAVVSCALPLSRHIDLLPHATLIFYFVEPKKLSH